MTGRPEVKTRDGWRDYLAVRFVPSIVGEKDVFDPISKGPNENNSIFDEVEFRNIAGSRIEVAFGFEAGTGSGRYRNSIPIEKGKSCNCWLSYTREYEGHQFSESICFDDSDYLEELDIFQMDADGQWEQVFELDGPVKIADMFGKEVDLLKQERENALQRYRSARSRHNKTVVKANIIFFSLVALLIVLAIGYSRL